MVKRPLLCRPKRKKQKKTQIPIKWKQRQTAVEKTLRNKTSVCISLYTFVRTYKRMYPPNKHFPSYVNSKYTNDKIYN